VPRQHRHELTAVAAVVFDKDISRAGQRPPGLEPGCGLPSETAEPARQRQAGTYPQPSRHMTSPHIDPIPEQVPRALLEGNTKLRQPSGAGRVTGRRVCSKGMSR
jgi:hypothetical protein